MYPNLQLVMSGYGLFYLVNAIIFVASNLKPFKLYVKESSICIYHHGCGGDVLM